MKLRTIHTVFLSFLCAFLFSCERDSFTPPQNPPTNPPTTNPPTSADTWLVPREDVLDGGPGLDGIPSVDQPTFETVEEADLWLEDTDLVIGVKLGDIIRAYPHPILDWHEIVNDQIDTMALAITYCPLTGTGIGWNRKTRWGTTTFGVSGLLYQTNLMPYDRNSNSIWSQMLMKSVNGNLISSEINTYQMVETSWETWKEMYPDSEILSRNTGHNRSYGFYPYGDYRRNNEAILFPVDTLDTRIPTKERVLGIVTPDRTWTFRFSKFKNGVETVNASIPANPTVVVGSEEANILIAYSAVLTDGTRLEFEPIQGRLPVAMIDNEGTEWDIFGYAVSGPRAGEKLLQRNAFIGYWFTFPTFYETVIYPG